MDVIERIERALDQVRPALRIDGGNVEFLEYDQETRVVRLRLLGACGDCSMSAMTMKMGVEHAIRKNVPEVRSVEAV